MLSRNSLLKLGIFSLALALGLIWGTQAKAAYRGEQVLDNVPPASPSQIKLVANSQGQVTITWVDPIDVDLMDIVVERDHLPLAGTIGNVLYGLVAIGSQSFVDVGLKQNEAYLYRIRSRDLNGNISQNSDSYKITVPSLNAGITAGTNVTQPEQATPTSPTGQPVTESMRLVKTVSATTVYLVYNNQAKYSFSTEAIFRSWFPDFKKVEIVTDGFLATLRTGSPLKMRAGTYLVKKSSDPKVYALEPDGNLRWISSEQIAVQLYGSDWNKRVIDVPESFLNNFVLGKQIVGILPDAAVIQYQGYTDKYFIEDGTKRVIPTYSLDDDLFQDKFVVKNVPTSVNYPISTNYENQTLKLLMNLD